MESRRVCGLARVPQYLLLVCSSQSAEAGLEREECSIGKGNGVVMAEELVHLLFQVAPKIKARMMERGTTMVGYQPDKQRPNFFRMIVSNNASTKEDMDFLVEEIDRLGRDL